jgi:predicted transcriptional regulator
LSKARKQKSSLEPSIAKAFAHPLRVQILTILTERVSSPSLLSKELSQSLNLVAYHVRVLEKYDCIELVETKPRRGATEHFYRATGNQLLSDSEWARFEALDDRHVSRTSLIVDEEGWREVTKVVEDARARLAAAQDSAAKRLKRSGEPGATAKVEILHSKIQKSDS